MLAALDGMAIGCGVPCGGCCGGAPTDSDFATGVAAGFFGARDLGLAFGALLLLLVLPVAIGPPIGVGMGAASGDVDAEFEPDEPAEPLPVPGACDGCACMVLWLSVEVAGGGRVMSFSVELKALGRS